MPEPIAIYSIRGLIFDKELSNVQNLIMMQGGFALEATVHRIKTLYSVCGPKYGNKVFPNPNISAILQDLCAQAGIASQILFNGNPNKSRLESQTAYNLRVERYEYVQQLCRQHQFDPAVLTNREVRNALTHIDERMADILTKEEGVGWFVDYAASIRDALEPPPNVKKIEFCRTYIHNESLILHLGNELNLDTLMEECITALKIIFNAKSIA